MTLRQRAAVGNTVVAVVVVVSWWQPRRNSLRLPMLPRGSKTVVTSLHSYATLRLIPVVRRWFKSPPSIPKTRRGRLAR